MFIRTFKFFKTSQELAVAFKRGFPDDCHFASWFELKNYPEKQSLSSDISYQLNKNMTSNVDKMLRDRIEKSQKKWDELMKAKEWTSLVNGFYAPNAKVTPPGGETFIGKQAIKTFFESYFDGPVWQITKVDEVNGEKDKEWAFTRGTYKCTDGTNELDSGKYVTIWRKIVNDYVVWATMWNTSRKRENDEKQEEPDKSAQIEKRENDANVEDNEKSPQEEKNDR